MIEPNQQWQKSAIEDLENTNLSMAEIAAKYGRSVHTVRKLRRLYNVTRKIPQKRRGPHKVADMVSLSPEHRALGSRLTTYRGSRTYSDVAAELGVSRSVLKLMEIGAYDFTLTHLMRIANLLGRPVQDIITPIVLVERRPVQPDGRRY